MKIEFNGAQETLKKIIALYENGQDIEVSCPECSSRLYMIKGKSNFPYLLCESCKKEWKLDPQTQSRGEKVWEKFESWEADTLKNK